MTKWYITKDLIIKSTPTIKDISDNIQDDVFDTYTLALLSLMKIERKIKKKNTY